MIIEAFGTGATLETAREIARRNLSAPDNALVQFDVISLGKKKLLGLFGGEDAKVRAYYEAPDEKKPAPVKEAPKKTEAKKPEEKAEKPAKQAPKKAEADKKPAKQDKPKTEKKAAEKPAEKPEKAEEAAKPEKAEEAEKHLEADAVSKYLTDVITLMGYEGVKVDVYGTEKSRSYKVTGLSADEEHELIGRHGETLDAIQYLSHLVSNKENKHFDRISINIGTYRERRADYLTKLANRYARQVRKFGKPVSLDHMNPYERRIVHTAIQGIEGVTSYSDGEGNDRHIIIALEEGFEPTSKREPKKAAQPIEKHDGEGTSRYGKIEVPGQETHKQKPKAKPAPVKKEQKPQSETVAKTSLYGKIEVPAAPKAETEE